jgi:hypothetical protein
MPLGKHATTGLEIDLSSIQCVATDSPVTSHFIPYNMPAVSPEQRNCGFNRTFFDFPQAQHLTDPISPRSEQRLDRLMEGTIDFFLSSEEGLLSRFPSVFSNSSVRMDSCVETVRVPSKRKHAFFDGSRESTPDASPTSATWNEWNSHSNDEIDEPQSAARGMETCSFSLLQQNLGETCTPCSSPNPAVKIPRVEVCLPFSDCRSKNHNSRQAWTQE